MNIQVNGDPRQLADGATVAALLAELGMTEKPVAVEVNRHLVPKRDHEGRVLSEGDQVEVVTLVGGG